jgi:hypothetical protein
VAEIRFNLQEAPEPSLHRHRQHLGNRRLEPPLMAHAENEAGITAQADGALGPGARERQRLFAEDMLAGAHDSRDLLLVQRMRRDEQHGIDCRICKDVAQALAHRNVMRGSEACGRGGVDLDGTSDLDGTIAVESDGDLLPPPTQADEGYFDRFHVISLLFFASCCCRARMMIRRLSHRVCGGTRHRSAVAPTPGRRGRSSSL